MRYITRKATYEDALEVARNIREEDLKEVEGLGHTRAALPFSVAISTVSITFCDEDGTVAGVAGISPTEVPRQGTIWMLCTPTLQRKPITFVREARRWLAEQDKDWDLLWNVTSINNHFHHKLLKMLGFKALRIVQPPPNYLPYYEIVRLSCASH
jgi:hypothetical protein